MYVEGSVFTSPDALSSAVYAENALLITFKAIHAYNIYSPMRRTTLNYLYGGFLNCETCTKMVIQNSLFENINSANYGGVLYVMMLDANKPYSNGTFPAKPTYLINGTTFKYCEADYGGVLYNDNADYFLIANSTFLNNLATQNAQLS